MMTVPDLIFVYGTLKHGYGNNRRLAEAQFLGEATSLDNFHLYAAGVPFLVDAVEGHPVRGELYVVDANELESCDRLEGHPHNYRRVLRKFCRDNGTCVSAWVYLWPRSTASMASFAISPDKDGVLEWNNADRLQYPAALADDKRRRVPTGYAHRNGYRKLAVSFPDELFQRLQQMVEDSEDNKTFSEIVCDLIEWGELVESNTGNSDDDGIPAKVALPSDVKQVVTK